MDIIRDNISLFSVGFNFVLMVLLYIQTTKTTAKFSSLKGLNELQQEDIARLVKSNKEYRDTLNSSNQINAAHINDKLKEIQTLQSTLNAKEKALETVKTLNYDYIKRVADLKLTLKSVTISNIVAIASDGVIFHTFINKKNEGIKVYRTRKGKRYTESARLGYYDASVNKYFIYEDGILKTVVGAKL